MNVSTIHRWYLASSIQTPKILAVVILIMLGMSAAGFVAVSRQASGPDQSNVQSGHFDRQELISQQLQELLAPVGVKVLPGRATPDVPLTRQLRVQWETSSPNKSALSAEQTAGSLKVTKSRLLTGALPRLRSVELAETQLLVIAVDDKSTLIWWHVIPDPRVIRSETVGPKGEISGRLFYQPKADFAITFPDDPAIKQLHLYHPRWTGEKYQLLSIGALIVQ